MTRVPSAARLGAGKLLAGRVGGVAGSLVAGQLLVGLTYVLAARSMPPAGLGLVATCFAIGTIGATVFDVGLTSYLVREVAADKVSMQRARSLVSAKRRVTPLLVVPTMLSCLLIMPSPVEGIVLVVESGRAHRGQAKNTLKRLRETGGQMLGVVLTKFDSRSVGYGYNYYYQSYYSYRDNKDDKAS